MFKIIASTIRNLDKWREEDPENRCYEIKIDFGADKEYQIYVFDSKLLCGKILNNTTNIQKQLIEKLELDIEERKKILRGNK